MIGESVCHSDIPEGHLIERTSMTYLLLVVHLRIAKWVMARRVSTSL